MDGHTETETETHTLKEENSHEETVRHTDLVHRPQTLDVPRHLQRNLLAVDPVVG